ncbi:MAG: response regulator transcription factor [Bdellovibrionales bacterium]
MRGLYAEDDLNLAASVIESLKEKNIEVLWARSVAEAIDAISREDFKFYILDVGLLDGEGYDIAKYLNEKQKTGPVLFLTARNSADDRLKGYELGAVEYIPKPFLFAELWIRLNHVLTDHVEEESLELGDLKINFKAYSFNWKDAETLFLSEKEFGVFLCLYKNAPAVVRRSDILDQVWGKDQFPSERTVDNIILKLRNNLKQYGSYVKSIRGVGYSWVTDK